MKSRREEKYLDDDIVMNDVEDGFGTRMRREYWAEVQDRQRWEQNARRGKNKNKTKAGLRKKNQLENEI